MRDLEFLKEVISEVSNGEHELIPDPNMDPVTLTVNDGAVELTGNTTSELWNSYKNLTGKNHIKLK